MNKSKIMGIINVTPDSFFSGSRHDNAASVLKEVEKMIAEGADIIDIGGVSTRPGSTTVSAETEEERVIPIVKAVKKHFPEIEISVDTFRVSVADKVCDEGCNIINDISGGFNSNIFYIAARHKAKYILMHYYGDGFGRMHEHKYNNLIPEMMDYFNEKILEVKSAGVEDIIIDPGFGFSKTTEESFEVLKQLSKFKELGYPILAGLSRKSMIYRTLNINPEEAINGTSVLNAVALINGADILRVHDVREAVQTRKLIHTLSAVGN